MIQAVPVLMYHHVCPHPGLVTVSPETFEAHMAYLTRRGYHALSAEEFLEFMQGKRQLSERSVLITFDDGYLDNYVHAYPILQRHRLKATIFAITGRLGEGPPRAHAGSGASLPATPDHRGCQAALAEGRADEVMLRWSEIEAMQAGGVEVHSHTHTHQRWERLYAERVPRLAALEVDLRQSRAMLQQRLGVASRHLCWPWGYLEPGYQELAEKIGFAAQYSTVKGTNSAGSNLRQIARVVIKDKPAAWLGVRLAIYRRPWLARCYLGLRGA